MLREWKEPVRPGEEELKMRLAAAREKLACLLYTSPSPRDCS